ncbi:MAG TPA: efflux RND transporter periplasmic adaptor subunit [Gemmatimonadaceae bacterium]|nr:efflux RND transporter periplasmic adaptor subunit [Gemmatimonadaceae bacterium]
MTMPLHRSVRAAAWRAMLATLLAVAACGRANGSDEEGTSGEVQPVVGAETAPVATRPFTETVSAIGSVTPRAGHSAALSAPAPARVSRVYVTAGAHVRRGEPLVALEQTTFRASAQSAEAALRVAEQAYERAQRLEREGIAPRKDVEQADAELARARADVVAARRAEELSVLRSPIDGVVTRMSATLGASADPSQTLVEVADPSALDVLLQVTPTEAARVHPGVPVALSAGQRSGGESLGDGRVADVAGTVDSATRSVAVRVLATHTSRPLRIGETVFGAIAVATRPNAIVVPLEALVPEGDGYKVFVVDRAGIAHARVVSVGGRADSIAEITRGLRAGERVVTYGAYGVQDSARIVPARHAPGADTTAGGDTMGGKP